MIHTLKKDIIPTKTIDLNLCNLMLVKRHKESVWELACFIRFDENNNLCSFHGEKYKYYLPFIAETKHLLGTINNINIKFILNVYE